MNLIEKNKDELIEEIAELRKRISELENASKPAKRNIRVPRIKLDSDIEVTGDFDVIHAAGVDISSGGICLETTQDMLFKMRFEYDGEAHERDAQLAWVKHDEENGTRYGFKFLKPETNPAITHIMLDIEQ